METRATPLPSGARPVYRLVPAVPDLAHPTLVLLHSFTTHLELHGPQYSDQELTSKLNLLAVDELGHGRTQGPLGWSYWETAKMVLDLLYGLCAAGKDELGINTVYALGTSQGGFIVARMAILRPDKIKGIIPIGSSMYGESPWTRELGCWNVDEVFKSWYESFASDKPTPEFVVPQSFCDDLIHVGFGDAVTPEQHAYWSESIKKTYPGDEGRKKILMCTVCLGERDSLEHRLPEIICPVLVAHGTKDLVYSPAIAKRYAKQLVNARSVKVEFIEGGQHFLSVSHPKETNELVARWVLEQEQEGGNEGLRSAVHA